MPEVAEIKPEPTSAYILRDALGDNNQSEVNKAYLEILADAWVLYLEKQKDYGDYTWRSLGARGVFCYLWQRILRFKNLIWDNEVKLPRFDSFMEATLDLVNYSVFLAILTKKKLWK